LLDDYIINQLYNISMINDSDQLDRTFAALADPTRRAILARLSSGEATVSELMQPFAMSQPAISRHLKVLEQAGLISRGRDAQRRPRRLEAAALAGATEWLERYRRIREESFERLDQVLDELGAEPGNGPEKRSPSRTGKRGRR
jgi:DNA-binding transcriptional ArsR family regulator